METDNQIIKDICQQFTDFEFMKYCYQNFDSRGIGEVASYEIEAVRDLHLQSLNIYSLEDLAYFKRLQVLCCNYSPLLTLDLKHNPLLEEIDCRNEKYMSRKLESVDVSNNPRLRKIDVSCNRLKILDLSHCPHINVINCSSNEGMDTLILPKDASLDKLYIAETAIEYLDLSSLRNVKEMIISESLETLILGDVVYPEIYSSNGKYNLKKIVTSREHAGYYQELFPNASIEY